MGMPLFAGIDISTQSITISVLGIQKGLSAESVYEHSIAYTKDERLAHYNLDADTKLLPSNIEGEANQPPLLFLDALECLMLDMSKEVEMKALVCVSISAQQHGHVYCNEHAQSCFDALKTDGKTALKTTSEDETLSHIFRDAFSYPHAPIWMTSVSQTQADKMRAHIGGSEKMQSLSGSDSPARFTGAVIKYIAETYPQAYEHTDSIQLLSSFFSGVLSGINKCPIDWGNGSGMSLMDYKNKQWSSELLCAVDVPPDAMSETDNLKHKLPALVSPLEIVGRIAPYFIQKYGFSKDCMIAAGSGDNPQSKVAVQGSLLSLGTSFVIMAECKDFPYTVPSTNAMYDGLGNPFVFGCRTNGALVWDKIRKELALDFEACESLLSNSPISNNVLLWQPLTESFPVSRSFEKIGDIHNAPVDYVSLVDSTLALLHYHASPFMSNNVSSDVSLPLYVTGGPSKSKEILKRIAAFWGRPVIKIKSTGASFGAAFSAYIAYSMKAYSITSGEQREKIEEDLYTKLISNIMDMQNPIIANKEDIKNARDFEVKVIKKFEHITR